MSSIGTNSGAFAPGAARTPFGGGAQSADTGAGRSKLAFILMIAFLISLLTPIYLPVGPVLLMPHRLVLLVSFVPTLILLLSGRVGRVLIVDWLFIAAALWAMAAFMLNPAFGSRIEPMGVLMLEFLGAYLLGRVSIRSTRDFMVFCQVFFASVVVLVPFAAIESVTYRPVLLDIIPKSVEPVYTHHRWGMRRAQTIFAHPILFGVYVSVGFGLFWYVLRPNWMRILSAPIVVAGTVFSLSTGALMSVVFQVVFISWEFIFKRMRKRWTLFSILAAMAYIAVDLLSNRTPFHVLITYATFNTGSAYNRILIWQFGMDNVWANPWFGLGLDIGNWARPSWMSSSADNFWLFLAMKYGVPMFAFFALALWIVIKRLSFAPLVSEQDRACRAGYLVAIGGIIMAGGTVHYWHAMMAFILFFMGSGIWMISGGAEAEPGETDEAVEETAPARNSQYARTPVLHVRGGPAAEPPAQSRATRGKVPPSRARLAKYRRQDGH